jgi:hypothetical protein
LGGWEATLSEQQLQQLCSCCSAVKSLRLHSCCTLSPVLQLSSLTHLSLDKAGAASAAMVGVAAQLIGLKQLELCDLSDLAGLALLQLTALTALEKLTLSDDLDEVCLRKKVGDNWMLAWQATHGFVNL